MNDKEYEDLFIDDVMRDVWKRKAEVSKQLLAERDNPKLREERYAQWRAAGVKFADPEEMAVTFSQKTADDN